MDYEKLLMQLNGSCPTPGAAVGDLPCEAAVGMTYTPMQRSGSDRYEPHEALSRGTLYPGLDLPLGNDYRATPVAKTPLSELQALDFALVELGLYLDTHPCDKEAAELYRAFRVACKAKREEYVKHYGPISKSDVADGDYAWVSDPWPWDYASKRGV